MPFFWSLFAQAKVSDTVIWVDKLARAPISKVVIFAAVITILRVIVFPTLRNTPVHKRDFKFTLSKWVNEFGDAVAYAAIVVFLLIRPFGIQTFVIPSGSMIDTLHVGDYIVANKFVYRASEPKHGDIVVLKPPAFVRKSPDEDYIKRLVGLPGDLVEIRHGKDYPYGKLFRNGVPVDEAYWTFTDPTLRDDSQTVIPKDHWSTLPVIADFKLVQFHGEIIPLQFDGQTANDPYSPTTNTTDRYALANPTDQQEAMALPPIKIPPGYYLFMGDNRNGSSDGRFWGLVPRDQIVGKAWFTWLPLARWKMLDNAPPESTK